MSALREHLRDYLELRRGLGFKLQRNGLYQLLPGLVSYLEAAGAQTVTTEHALAWATAPAGADLVLVAAAAGGGPAVRPLPGRRRPGHAGPAARAAARPGLPPGGALPVFAGRGHRADRRCRRDHGRRCARRLTRP